LVRLKCRNKNCSKVWLESKSQRASDHVFCPKCGELNHSHSKPIIPNKPFIVNKDTADESKAKNRKKGVQAKPADTFSLRQLGVVDGKVKGYALGYRTVEKEKKEDE
jgi:phage FluMu protein Com